MGVVDTVRAFTDDSAFDLSLNNSVRHCRHALALHEDRRDLAPQCIFPDPETLRNINSSGRSFVQAWFVGSHDDLCGSSERGGLSLYPLQWMLLEISMLGLSLAFHGNAPNAPSIDDPLRLVFPPDEESGKGADIWSCTSENGITTTMQDLRRVHELPAYGGRYAVQISRASGPWFKKAREAFVKKPNASIESSLQGYCSEGKTIRSVMLSVLLLTTMQRL